MACVRDYKFLIDVKMLYALKVWLIDTFQAEKSNVEALCLNSRNNKNKTTFMYM